MVYSASAITNNVWNGIGIKNYQDIREKDQFETFLVEEVQKTE